MFRYDKREMAGAWMQLDQQSREPPVDILYTPESVLDIVKVKSTEQQFTPIISYYKNVYVGINSSHVCMGGSKVKKITNISKDSHGYKVFGPINWWTNEPIKLLELTLYDDRITISVGNLLGSIIKNDKSVDVIIRIFERYFKDYTESFEKRYHQYKINKN